MLLTFITFALYVNSFNATAIYNLPQKGGIAFAVEPSLVPRTTPLGGFEAIVASSTSDAFLISRGSCFYGSRNGSKFKSFALDPFLSGHRVIKTRDGNYLPYAIAFNSAKQTCTIFFPFSWELTQVSFDAHKAVRFKGFMEAFSKIKRPPPNQIEGNAGCKIVLSADQKSLAISVGVKGAEVGEIGDIESGTYICRSQEKSAKFVGFGAPVGWLSPTRLVILRPHFPSNTLRIVDLQGHTIWQTKHVAAAAVCKDRLYIGREASHLTIHRLFAYSREGKPTKKYDLTLGLGFVPVGGKNEELAVVNLAKQHS